MVAFQSEGGVSVVVGLLSVFLVVAGMVGWCVVLGAGGQWLGVVAVLAGAGGQSGGGAGGVGHVGGGRHGVQ